MFLISGKLSIFIIKIGKIIIPLATKNNVKKKFNLINLILKNLFIFFCIKNNFLLIKNWVITVKKI